MTARTPVAIDPAEQNVDGVLIEHESGPLEARGTQQHLEGVGSEVVQMARTVQGEPVCPEVPGQPAGEVGNVQL